MEERKKKKEEKKTSREWRQEWQQETGGSQEEGSIGQVHFAEKGLKKWRGLLYRLYRTLLS
jgi:hypothetical protein